MISGSPAIFRFHAPFIGMLVSRVCGSVHSSTWWEK
jgi:hypothetical protein